MFLVILFFPKPGRECHFDFFFFFVVGGGGVATYKITF
jgi:hypothetical protein